MSTLSISALGDLNINVIDHHHQRNEIKAAKVPPRPAPGMPIAADSIAVEKQDEIAKKVAKTSPKVVVVGAGISGLRAAAVLQRHGVDVIVLEGRPDRIGGRILTSRQQGRSARDIGKYT